MKGEELAAAVNAFAIYSAKYLSAQELATLAVVFTQLADTYATIAHIRDTSEDANETICR